MRAEFINPFLQAATEVLESELGSTPRRGSIGLQRSAYTSDDVTAVVAVTGDVAGMVLFAMTTDTARAMVSRMMGQEFPELDALAQSGIAEISNVITGRAAVLLSEAGFPSDLAPPMLLVGRNTLISTLDVQRLVIPLETELGKLEIQVALKVSNAAASRRGQSPRSLDPRLGLLRVRALRGIQAFEAVQVVAMHEIDQFLSVGWARAIASLRDPSSELVGIARAFERTAIPRQVQEQLAVIGN